jgi:epoxyqueuosine reductase
VRRDEASEVTGPNAVDYGFEVVPTRFDQKNEMFKRAVWDENFIEKGRRFYRDAPEFDDRLGWEHRDWAAAAAAWNLEDRHAKGNVRGNFGMYEWEGMSGKGQRIVHGGRRAQGKPEEMSRDVKRIALQFGASAAGVCRVHPAWVYSHQFSVETGEHKPLELPSGMDNAVVLAIPMDYHTVRSASQPIANIATGLGYSQMAIVANLVASFIRYMGYRAIPSGNDTAMSIPMAMAAGLGELGRLGLLVTEKHGPRVRLCKVFTDMPLAPDRYRPFGVAEFCKVCKLCTRYCPAKAISDGDMTTEGPTMSNQHGPRKWYINPERCFSYWAEKQVSCSRCIRSCAFNKLPGPLHDLTRAIIKRTSLLNPLIVRIDKLLRYAKPYHAKRYWPRRQA